MSRKAAIFYRLSLKCNRMLLRYDRVQSLPDCFHSCTTSTVSHLEYLPEPVDYRRKVSVKQLKLKHSASTPLHPRSQVSSARLVPSELQRHIIPPHIVRPPPRPLTSLPPPPPPPQVVFKSVPQKNYILTRTTLPPPPGNLRNSRKPRQEWQNYSHPQQSKPKESEFKPTKEQPQAKPPKPQAKFQFASFGPKNITSLTKIRTEIQILSSQKEESEVSHNGGGSRHESRTAEVITIQTSDMMKTVRGGEAVQISEKQSSQQSFVIENFMEMYERTRKEKAKWGTLSEFIPG